MTMMSTKICFSSINRQNKQRITDEDYVVDSSLPDDDVSNNVLSSDSDLFDDDDDEVNSSPISPSSGSKSPTGPLQDMSSIIQELPIKRGLSKHYNGKSQSFTSLANVSRLEDLAKPENPLNKRLKSCKSYGLLELHRLSQPHRSASSSRLISKKASSSLLPSRGSFYGNSRPAIPPPHRSNSSTTSLFE